MNMYKNNIYKWAGAITLSMLLLSGCGTAPSQEPHSKLSYIERKLSPEGISLEPGSAYYLPFGEGNYIPANDPVWKEYLNGKELEGLESFSMPFAAVDCGDKALVYIMENPYRTSVHFSYSPDLRLEFVGEKSSLAPDEENNIRVYTTENNAVAIANVYKSYLAETGPVLTLAEKEKENPNISKLYGAPHIYEWGDLVLSKEDVKWAEFKKAVNSPVLAHVGEVLAHQKDADSSFTSALHEISGQDYVSEFQKNELLRGISTAITQEDFYDGSIFPKSNEVIKNLLAKGTLNQAERIELNKQALYENLPGVFNSVSNWYNHDSVDIVNEMKAAGIDTAWIGLNSWEQGYNKPQLVETAVKDGYLVGPYDSYHSIHEPGKEQWITAKFPDSSLYENATVQNEKGEKIAGFQNVGRKLNPTLAMPFVKQRVQEILDTGLLFNSWFVDCDATGEVYDDYSPAHPTTKQQDVAARRERMEYIAREHHMVVGSEGGNDYAANSIAFAHGIELPSFSWMDADMNKNKDSEYYLGKWYSANGGVPEKFAKPVPLKEKFRALFLDMSYQIPLFKLVYNDSVITTYHWDWSTFKIAGESQNRMLREVLYNVPPLYHLDRTQWDTYKDQIVAHNAVWSPFSKKAITRPMTEFKYLSNDRLVQMTQYGSDLQAIANFSGAEFSYEGTAIPSRSVLIIDGGNKSIYTPK